MTQGELQELWSETPRQKKPTVEQFDRLAEAVLDLYGRGDRRFREHAKNRFTRVTEVRARLTTEGTDEH